MMVAVAGCSGVADPDWAPRGEDAPNERREVEEAGSDGGRLASMESELSWLQATRLVGISVASGPNGEVVRLYGDGAFRFSTFSLEGPDRFVIDLEGVMLADEAPRGTEGRGPILGVRTGQFQQAPVPIARVVLDLVGPLQTELEIQRRADGLEIRHGAAAEDRAGAAAGEGPASERVAAAGDPIAPMRTERESPRRELPWSRDRGRSKVAADYQPDWSVLPLYGADVRAFAFDPEDPDHVLLGTAGGHLYRSIDGGRTWRDAGITLPFHGWVVSALAFDPHRGERLWMSGWGVFGGGIVAFTEDFGVTWTVRREGLETRQVYSLALAPDREGRLFAGTRDGVYGSRDDGMTWEKLTHSVPEAQKVTSLAIDPFAPWRILAGTWRQAYRSNDGGATWALVPTGMVLDTEVFTMVPVPGRPGELWASTCGWVYHGSGFGDTWSRRKAWEFERRRVPSFQVLSAEHLLAGTILGLEVSTDGGQTWSQRGPQGMPILVIGYDPRRPDRVLIGTEGDGVWRSLDRGEHFAPTTRGLTNVRVQDVVRVGGELLFAVRDAGPRSGIYRSSDDGETFFREGLHLPPVVDLTVAAGRTFAATNRGLYERVAGEWRRIGEIGERRVERVEAGGAEVVAVTRAGLFVSSGGLFTPLPYTHAAPRSVAVTADAIWVADAEKLHRLTAVSNHTVTPPFPAGRLLTVGRDILWSGEDGTYLHTPEADGWRRLGEKHAVALATGDPERPAVLLKRGGPAVLLDPRGQRLGEIELPVPASQVVSVLLDGDEIYLGTNGQGAWKGRL